MSSGLYGSSTAENMSRAAVAEFIGTFFLVFVGTAVAVTAALKLPIAGSPADSLAVALAFGLTLVALVYAFGHISGCHLNPAVTFGLTITNKFPLKYAAAYIGSQLLGAISASLVLWLLFGDTARSQAELGATQPAHGVGDFRVFGIELAVTFFLVLVIMAVATDDRAESASSGLAVGIALFGAVAVAGAFTGGAVNPARALGPMIVSGHFAALWAYILGPVVGGGLSALVYEHVLSKATEPSEAEG